MRHGLSKGGLGWLATRLNLDRTSPHLDELGVHARDHETLYAGAGMDAIDSAVRRALAGLNASIEASTDDGLDDRFEVAPPMDPLFAELLAHRGLSTRACDYLQSRLGGDMHLVDADTGETVAKLRFGGRRDDHVLVDGIGPWWGSGTLNVRQRLPEVVATTLAQGLRGRPLVDLVGHPVLDRHPLRITHVKVNDNGTLTVRTERDAGGD